MYLTINIPPRHATAALAGLPGLFSDTGASAMAFIVRAHPEEPPHLEKVTRAMACFDRAREVLAPLGVRCGVLLQTLLGHGERSTPVSPAPFQHQIGADGSTATSQFCPLDAQFLAHTADTCREIAAHAPDFILLDDDVRLAGQPPLHYGCFCPLHRKLHAASGRGQVSPAALAPLLTADSPAGQAAREAWQATLDDSLMLLAGQVRQAIDTVNPAVRCGICLVAGLRPLARRLADTLAGGTRPLIRVGQAFYNERGAKFFPLVMAVVGQQRQSLPPPVETLSEADSYPQTRYSLSATGLRAYIAGTLLQGIDAADVWLSPTRNWAPEPGLGRMLARHRGLFAALPPLIREMERLGPACLSTGRERTAAPWTAQSGQAVHPPFWAGVLGRLGLPCYSGPAAAGVSTLDGIAAQGLADAEITALLAGGLLLDGEAAAILCRRGYADLLGVEAVEDNDLRGNYEACETVGPAALPEDCHLLSARRQPREMLRLTACRPGVLVQSWLMRTPAFQHPEEERVAPALTLFENAAGGRVAVFAHALGRFSELLFMSAERRRQITGVLDWLNRAPLPRVVPGDDVYAVFGKLPGNRRLLAAFNLSLDTVESLAFLPDGGIADLERLTAAGSWETIACRQADGIAHTGLNLPTLEPAVLRWCPA